MFFKFVFILVTRFKLYFVRTKPEFFLNFPDRSKGKVS